MSQVLRLPPAIFFMSVSMLEEMRVLLMYYIAAESFIKIRHAIEEQVMAVDTLTIPYRVVTSWTRIIFGLRNLVRLTGHLQAPSLIPTILHTTLVFTGFLFFAIQAILTGRGAQYLTLVAIFGGSFIVQLILKIIMAENILSEVQQIQDESKWVIACQIGILIIFRRKPSRSYCSDRTLSYTT